MVITAGTLGRSALMNVLPISWAALLAVDSCVGYCPLSKTSKRLYVTHTHCSVERMWRNQWELVTQAWEDIGRKSRTRCVRPVGSGYVVFALLAKSYKSNAFCNMTTKVIEGMIRAWRSAEGGSFNTGDHDFSHLKRCLLWTVRTLPLFTLRMNAAYPTPTVCEFASLWSLDSPPSTNADRTCDSKRLLHFATAMKCETKVDRLREIPSEYKCLLLSDHCWAECESADASERVWHPYKMDKEYARTWTIVGISTMVSGVNEIWGWRESTLNFQTFPLFFRTLRGPHEISRERNMWSPIQYAMFASQGLSRPGLFVHHVFLYMLVHQFHEDRIKLESATALVGFHHGVPGFRNGILQLGVRNCLDPQLSWFRNASVLHNWDFTTISAKGKSEKQ